MTTVYLFLIIYFTFAFILTSGPLFEFQHIICMDTDLTKVMPLETSGLLFEFQHIICMDTDVF